MPISYVGAGAIDASNNGTTAPSLPSGLVDGDLLLACFSNKNVEAIPNELVGWTRWTLGEGLNTQSSPDQGSPRETVFTRTFVTGDAAPGVTLSGGSPNVCLGIVHALRKTVAGAWDVGLCGGLPSSPTVNPVDLSGDIDPGIAAGDVLMYVTGVSSDSGSFSAGGTAQASVPGCTVENPPLVASQSSTAQGADARLLILKSEVLSGVSTGPPVASSDHIEPLGKEFQSLVLRIREPGGDTPPPETKFGTASGSSASSGSVSGSPELRGDVLGSSVSSGSVAGLAARFGQVAGVSASSGTVVGTAAKFGTATGTSTSSGQVSGEVEGGEAQDYVGTVSGVSESSGQVPGTPWLKGTTQGESASQGVVAGEAARFGWAEGESESAGTVEGLVARFGTAAGESESSGEITGLTTLVGTWSGGSQSEGNVAGVAARFGTVAGESTSTAPFVEGLVKGAPRNVILVVGEVGLSEAGAEGAFLSDAQAGQPQRVPTGPNSPAYIKET